MAEKVRDEHPGWFEVTYALVTGLGAIISVIVTAVHSYKVYQDLYTSERKCLDHRRTKPKVDAQYKKATRLTYISAALFSLIFVAEAINSNLNGPCAKAPVLISTFALYMAKGGLYLTYILRLHQVYGTSAYAYRRGTMICWAVIVVTCVIGIFIVHEIGNITDPVYYDDRDGVFPHSCGIDLSDSFFVVAIALVLFEITACIGSILAFTIPLNKVVKATHIDEDESSKRRADKIKYSGYKYKVLVISSSVFTLSWIVLFMVELPWLATIILAVDWLVNPVCLLLMTPYYPSNIYYERLCFFCIRCCDPRGESYKSSATQEQPRGSVVKSLDTSQVIRNIEDKRESATYTEKEKVNADKMEPVEEVVEEVTPAPTDVKVDALEIDADTQTKTVDP